MSNLNLVISGMFADLHEDYCNDVSCVLLFQLEKRLSSRPIITNNGDTLVYRYTIVSNLFFTLKEIKQKSVKDDKEISLMMEWSLQMMCKFAFESKQLYVCWMSYIHASIEGYSSIADYAYQNLIDLIPNFEGENRKYLIGIDTSYPIYGLGIFGYATKCSYIEYSKRVIDYFSLVLEKSDWNVCDYLSMTKQCDLPNELIAKKIEEYLLKKFPVITKEVFVEIDNEIISLINESKYCAYRGSLFFLLLNFTQNRGLADYAFYCYVRYCKKLEFNQVYAEFYYNVDFRKNERLIRISANCFEQKCLILLNRQSKGETLELWEQPDKLWMCSRLALKLIEFGNSHKYQMHLRSYL